MKKNYIMSSLIGIMIFFSCASCVFGGDKMGENYLVTINGIEMYKDASIELLRRIIREEKENVSIVNEDTKGSLDVTEEILKPGISIIINNSKTMERVSNLFKKARVYITESKDILDSKILLEDKDISIMKLSGMFSISDSNDINNRVILYVNDRLQIIKMRIFNDAFPSKIQNAIPVSE